MNSHTTIVQLNSEFDTLIKEIEATGAQQFAEIFHTLREISADYKYLEHKTRSAVRQTASVVSEVARTAGSNKLQPNEKIKLMKRDFAKLTNDFATLTWRHVGISRQLHTLAEKAETIKGQYDRRAEKAVAMKDNAQGLAMMSVPGVGMVGSVAHCVSAAAGSVNHPALKVAAGAGGAVGGVLVGALVTISSPILLAISGILAVKSKMLSGKFTGMHDMIRQLEEIMDQAAQHLSDINENLTALDGQIDYADKSANAKATKQLINAEFDRIKRICVKVSELCTEYEQLVDSKTKRMKQIDIAKIK